MPSRIIKSLVCGITTIAASVAMLGINAFSEEQNLDISINYDTNIEYPLSMDRSSEVFYFNGNINPGDKMHASILVKNTSEQNMQYALTDVIHIRAPITEKNGYLKLKQILFLPKVHQQKVFQKCRLPQLRPLSRRMKTFRLALKKKMVRIMPLI